MKRFIDLCFEELSFDDSQRMLQTLVSNSKGFKSKPSYQKEPFVTDTPAGVIKGYYEYSGGSKYAEEEYAEELFRQCKDEIKDGYLEKLFHHHKTNEQYSNVIHNYAQG